MLERDLSNCIYFTIQANHPYKFYLKEAPLKAVFARRSIFYYKVVYISVTMGLIKFYIFYYTNKSSQQI